MHSIACDVGRSPARARRAPPVQTAAEHARADLVRPPVTCSRPSNPSDSDQTHTSFGSDRRELSDTQQRGALDAPAFCVAMYLVQGCMSGAIAAIPPTLPPFLYAEAAQAAPGFVPAPSPSPASAPVPISVQQSSSTSDTGMPVPGTQPWTVSPEVRASADAFFEVLDERGAGFLDGEAARSHFMQSGLPQDAAAQVWCVVHTVSLNLQRSVVLNKRFVAGVLYVV